MSVYTTVYTGRTRSCTCLWTRTVYMTAYTARRVHGTVGTYTAVYTGRHGPCTAVFTARSRQCIWSCRTAVRRPSYRCIRVHRRYKPRMRHVHGRVHGPRPTRSRIHRPVHGGVHVRVHCRVHGPSCTWQVGLHGRVHGRRRPVTAVCSRLRPCTRPCTCSCTRTVYTASGVHAGTRRCTRPRRPVYTAV